MKKHECEFTALTEKEAKRKSLFLFHSEQAGQAEDNSSLCDHEHRSDPEYEQRHRKHGMNGQHHTNGTEKQPQPERSDAHTSELQSLMRISYDVFCLKITHSISSTEWYYN